ncbi:3-oxoacid CoA-transferase subunit B [Bacillus sp. 1NLA3E]|uniref:3-oxoacid CoA-transferase subunit B n=1 Tax=Bacillus sp. 1NLA3E TaxID=666686 RepID=UPI000247EAC7|nr:3-oxoacid CoA-transferase subunit B [Bacillus sp. 1NLA3E]AGK53397.1 acetate CoA-transferase subunit beta [Bacillus sp. 1NLA3E]
MSELTKREIIAKRVAKELHDGEVVNLGIGIPTLVSQYLPENINVLLQSENGFIGICPLNGIKVPDLVDASARPVGIIPGGSVFDSVMSLALIRGGHVDVTVLGGLQVDQEGNLANWMVPGGKTAGMGGAMDLVTGSKKVIIAMEHTAKDGSSKIVKRCTLPLTGSHVVSTIVTELAVFSVTDQGLLLEELQDGVDLKTVLVNTDAEFIVSKSLTHCV